jgi:RNA polymerase sigma-54 factor
MALELKQSLSLNQQLIMTPQLQQAIKLLQLSRLELLDSIYQEMEINPVLDEQLGGEADEETTSSPEKDEPQREVSDLRQVTVEERAREDVDWENYITEYNTGWAETAYEHGEPPPFENLTTTRVTLYSHLLWQLNMSGLREEEKEIAIHVIGNLTEDGYLDISFEELCATTGQPPEKVGEALALVQNFDPVGVAARDGRECLLIQLRFQGLDGTIAEKIITDHLRDLEEKRYDQIAKSLSVSLDEVVSAVSVIRTLEPKPGRIYSDEQTIYISPDIYVFKVGDDYQIALNEDGLPKLRVSPYYRDMLTMSDGLPDGTRTYIQDKLKSAAWLIKSIHQRQRTIYRVTESIVKFQRKFLDQGVTYLRPLVLRDVAEDIQMHESTISRVTTNKYVYTPQGIFELKFFFNSAISSVVGDSVASESVKQHIRNIVKSEDNANPLSDQEIADLLKEHNNIDVARRTVAKYREGMGILPSRKRRNPF